jgi:hypothetical protein
VLNDSREGRRKKESEKPDPKAFERFETLAKELLSAKKTKIEKRKRSPGRRSRAT